MSSTRSFSISNGRQSTRSAGKQSWSNPPQTRSSRAAPRIKLSTPPFAGRTMGGLNEFPNPVFQDSNGEGFNARFMYHNPQDGFSMGYAQETPRSNYRSINLIPASPERKKAWPSRTEADNEEENVRLQTSEYFLELKAGPRKDPLSLEQHALTLIEQVFSQSSSNSVLYCIVSNMSVYLHSSFTPPSRFLNKSFPPSPYPPFTRDG